MSSVSLVAIFRLVLVAIGILFGSHNEAAAYLKLENLGSECYEASVQERTSWYDGDVNKLFERGTRRAWRNAVTGREDLAEVRIALDRLQPNATRGTATIGRLKDLAKLGPGEKTLLKHLEGDLGSPAANWARNSGVLRQEMAKGLPIRDASVDAAGKLVDHSGTFLNAERNLLRDRGWSFDPSTTLWSPP